MPVLILFLFQHLDPVVGHTHSHAVVKPDAACLERRSKSRHTAHLLGNGDSLAVHLMDEFVGKGEISDGIGVLTTVVVVAIGAECLPEPVVIIEHRCHTVETKSIKLVLIEPEFAVGQEEMYHFILSIVKTERIPCRMLTTTVAIEILIVASVKASETFHLIFNGMGMNDVHDHGYAHLMSGINQRLKLLGSSETARRRIEARHMIAE